MFLGQSGSSGPASQGAQMGPAAGGLHVSAEHPGSVGTAGSPEEIFPVRTSLSPPGPPHRGLRGWVPELLRNLCPALPLADSNQMHLSWAGGPGQVGPRIIMHNDNPHDRHSFHPDERRGCSQARFSSEGGKGPNAHSHKDRHWGFPGRVGSGSPCRERIREQMEQESSMVTKAELQVP